MINAKKDKTKGCRQTVDMCQVRLISVYDDDDDDDDNDDDDDSYKQLNFIIFLF